MEGEPDETAKSNWDSTAMLTAQREGNLDDDDDVLSTQSVSVAIDEADSEETETDLAASEEVGHNS